MPIRDDVSTLFGIVRTIFQNDPIVLRKITQQYQDTITNRFCSLPAQYRSKVETMLKVIIALINSIDFGKLGSELDGVKFDITSHTLIAAAINKNLDALEKPFARGFIKDIQPLCACLDLVLAEPKKYANQLQPMHFLI